MPAKAYLAVMGKIQPKITHKWHKNAELLLFQDQ